MSLTNGEFKANLEGFFGNLKDILKENAAAKQEIAELRSRAARQAEEHETQRQHCWNEHMQQVAELEAAKQKLEAKLKFKRELIRKAWCLATVTQKTEGVKRKFGSAHVCEFHCDFCRKGYFDAGTLATHMNANHSDRMTESAKVRRGEVVAVFKKTKK